VGLAQLQAGLAWWYRKYAREQTVPERDTYAKLENQARTVGLGLWSDPRPVQPWEWRQRQRQRFGTATSERSVPEAAAVLPPDRGWPTRGNVLLDDTRLTRLASTGAPMRLGQRL
jgi:hypothetical protein